MRSSCIALLLLSMTVLAVPVLNKDARGHGALISSRGELEKPRYYNPTDASTTGNNDTLSNDDDATPDHNNSTSTYEEPPTSSYGSDDATPAPTSIGLPVRRDDGSYESRADEPYSTYAPDDDSNYPSSTGPPQYYDSASPSMPTSPSDEPDNSTASEEPPMEPGDARRSLIPVNPRAEAAGPSTTPLLGLLGVVLSGVDVAVGLECNDVGVNVAGKTSCIKANENIAGLPKRQSLSDVDVIVTDVFDNLDVNVLDKRSSPSSSHRRQYSYFVLPEEVVSHLKRQSFSNADVIVGDLLSGLLDKRSSPSSANRRQFSDMEVRATNIQDAEIAMERQLLADANAIIVDLTHDTGILIRSPADAPAAPAAPALPALPALPPPVPAPPAAAPPSSSSAAAAPSTPPSTTSASQPPSSAPQPNSSAKMRRQISNVKVRATNAQDMETTVERQPVADADVIVVDVAHGILKRSSADVRAAPAHPALPGLPAPTPAAPVKRSPADAPAAPAAPGVPALPALPAPAPAPPAPPAPSSDSSSTGTPTTTSTSPSSTPSQSSTPTKRSVRAGCPFPPLCDGKAAVISHSR